MKWSVKAAVAAAALAAATAAISAPAQASVMAQSSATVRASAVAGASVTPQIDARKCNPNDPTPQIEFFDTIGANGHCFGGTVGSIFPSFSAFTMHSGGYFGNFAYTDSATGKNHVVFFEPDDLIGFGPGIVHSVTITPRP
jgi:hypothetical protein